MESKRITCEICNISTQRYKKAYFRDISGDNYSGFRLHLAVAHATVAKRYVCNKDILKYSKERKTCTKACCNPNQLPTPKKPIPSFVCPKCPKISGQDKSGNVKHKQGKLRNQCGLKTVSKTSSRCVVCRKRVATGCTRVPRQAKIDFLIRYHTLIPDGARICKKHLSGKYLKVDINRLSIEKNVMSDEKLQEALEMLLDQSTNGKPAINFDGEMNYHTWTGT